MTNQEALRLRTAGPDDAPLVFDFICGLARYEKLEHEVVATPEGIAETLFGPHPVAEVLIAEWRGEPAGFALFFPNYSTFLGRPGMYLEDLFVLPEFRGHGIGKALLAHLAGISVKRGYGRLDWSVLDWNEPAIRFYRRIGARGLDEWTQYRLDGDALQRLGKSA
jgi:GNAT superfamily N-acetyltransferase